MIFFLFLLICLVRIRAMSYDVNVGFKIKASGCFPVML